MIRMLHIVGSMSPSGIGNFIMNVYRNIDRTKIQFDFIVHEHREVSFDDEIEALGGRLFYVTRKSVSPFRNFMEIRKIVRDGGYDVVFRHTDTATVALDLLAARLGGAKHRIPHSHSTSTPNRKMHRLFQPFLNAVSTERYACSQDAGKWLYGHQSFEVIWNGIAVEQFCFDADRRRKMRIQEGLEDNLVFGHVGNFLPVKNHLFMLEVFAEILKKDDRARLMFVGDGELREDIIKKSEELGIRKQVLLMGVRNDTADLLQAMDLFFFPSKYEGMPIALVEAQAAGLPCLISDTITENVAVTGLVHKKSLQENAEEWADRALYLAEETVREDTGASIRNGGFDCKELARGYENRFLPKILFHLHCLRKGGAERVVVNLAEKFLADGYRVVIAIEHRAQDDYQISPRIEKVFVGLEADEEIQIKGNAAYKMYGRISNFLKRIRHLRRLILAEKPNMVIAFAKAPNYRALLAVLGLHIPVIASVRNDPKVHYSGLGAKIFNKLLLARAAGCVFQTQEALEFFSKKLQKKSTVILNPIHQKYLEIVPADIRGKYLVNVGRMAAQKNQLLLIKAFEKISREFPEYELRIYGGETDDGTQEELFEYVEEHGLGSRVRFMGISDSLDREILDAAAFVLSSDYEGMPNVLMEAMAMGIPVISTDCPCGGPGTLISQRENGLLVPVGDAEGMADAIREILKDTALADKLGKNAMGIRETANIDRIYQEWKEYVKI